MPNYTVQDQSTGKTITFQWNDTKPPTDADMEQIFTEAKQVRPSASIPNTQIPSSPGELFFGGVGKGMVNIGRGIGQRLGMVSPEEIEESRRLDAIWGNNPYSKVGEFIGGTAPFAAIPAGGQFPLLARMLIGAGTGAGMGLIQPTTPKESVATNVLTGAALGGAAPAVLAPVGKVVHAATGRLSKGVEELKFLSKKYNIPLTLGEIKNSPILQKAETWLEAIPFAGISGFRIKQQARAEKAGLEFLSNYIKNPNADDIILTNRKYVQGLYEDLKQLIPEGIRNRAINVDEIRPVAKNLLDQFPDIFKMFQDTKRESLIRNIIAGTESTKTSLSGQISGQGITTAKKLTFEELWTLREGLGEMIGQAQRKLGAGDVSKTALSQLNQLYSAIYKQIDSYGEKIGKPEISTAIKTANQAYQQYVVKYRAIQQAMDKAEGVIGAGESFSPKKLSTTLKAIIGEQKWSEGHLFNADEINHMTGLIKIMQTAKRGGQFMENPPTGNRWGIPQMVGMGLGIPGGIAAAGQPGYALAAIGTEMGVAGLGKFLTTTQTGKALCLAASKLEPNSPQFLKIMYQVVPKIAARLGTNAQIKPEE